MVADYLVSRYLALPGNKNAQSRLSLGSETRLLRRVQEECKQARESQEQSIDNEIPDRLLGFPEM